MTKVGGDQKQKKNKKRKQKKNELERIYNSSINRNNHLVTS